LQAVTIAVRVAHKLNDPSFVREPVEKGRGHFVIGKNLIPVAKTQITGNDNGNLFIQIATLTNILQISITHSANSFR
jgi:hypothetical protein